jgi:hypothetical protein
MIQGWSDERVRELLTARVEQSSISGTIDQATSFIIWDLTENDRQTFNKVKSDILANPPAEDIPTAFVEALYEAAWEIVTQPE